MTEQSLLQRCTAHLSRPLDGAGLAAFRIVFGALMFFGVVRFWAYGWIEELYLAPEFHFKYWGFAWVKVWPGLGLYWHFAVMGAAAIGICLGAYTRISAAVFFLTFSYAELLDKSTYLNHYYLVSLMAGLLVVVPCSQLASVDARRRRSAGRAPGRVLTLHYVLLRSQVAMVYFFAGFAKLNGDWLLRAEPLRTWLSVRQDLPWVGEVFSWPVTAFGMSYWGAIFDLSIVGWLLWPKTRGWAFGLLVAFHISVWLLFPIGLFSWVMISVASLFLSPGWPRKLLRHSSGYKLLQRQSPPAGSPVAFRWVALASLYLLVQVALPLRFLAYPPGVNWHEQGYRFSWRVMLTEKSGHLQYRISTQSGQQFVVHPRAELTPMQYAMMRTQPDMIHAYAIHLRKRFEEKTGQRVAVRADSWVSFNGRRSRRLIDETVDLGQAPRGLYPKPWILPLRSTRTGLTDSANTPS